VTATRPCRRDAAFSRCGTYRYALWRDWDEGAPTVLFIALNPSTADHRRDDPTIRRCMGFARDWGFGRLVVANLFAYRTSEPARLRLADAPIGPRNDRWLGRLASDASLVLAAWGIHGDYLDRAEQVRSRLPGLHCLGTTMGGSPRHPLYVRRDARPVLLEPPSPSDVLSPTSICA
jgi:hypothetical protein